MKSLEELLNEAVDNIQKDRTVTKELLDDVITYLSKNEANQMNSWSKYLHFYKKENRKTATLR